MPFSILIFAYRKPGLSPAEFKSLYETSHIPLVQSVAGSHFPKAHVRRYIQRSQEKSAPASTDDVEEHSEYPATVLIGAPSDFEYDAIAELTFDDEAAFQAFFGTVSQQDAAEQIAKNEETFLDRPKMRVVVLGDCITTTG